MSYNVNRSVMDAFYRYKMPKIMAKVEGKGNGIKTVVVNMVDVAKALGRPPTYPCKYFGCELGAQTQFDTKNDRYIVNGSHEATKLQDLLDGFIKKFVLCPECENPETVLFPNEKKGIIKQSCKACGYQGLLDMRHKLTTFILKNHPDIKPNQPGTALTKRKERAKKTENGQKDSLRPNSPRADKSDASDNDMNGDPEDVSFFFLYDVVIRGAYKSGRKIAPLSLSQALLVFDTHIYKTKTTCTALTKRKERAKKTENGQKDSLRPNSPRADKSDASDNDMNGDPEDYYKFVNKFQIPQYRILLLLFTHGNPKSQKYFIGAVEKLIELNKDLLLPKVPMILKAMYDHDIVEEEVLLDWGKKISKKYVTKETAAEIHAKAQPFLKWLQEAEEEETTEEEEDDVEFDPRALSQSLKEQEAKIAGDTKPIVAEAPKIVGPGEEDEDDDDDDDSDLDIDNL
nr:eukaryotic translation initiation factor 5-like [Cherax quadricarinatus]